MLRYNEGSWWTDVASVAVVVLIVWFLVEHIDAVKSFLASWGVPVS